MRILSVNNSLDNAFRDMGHEVVSLSVTSPGFYSLHQLTDVAAFKPHVFIQKEHLGARILFNDIAALSCVKGFWSIDSHLNYYWQRYYGQLFDVFFTPHLAYLSCIADSWLHPNRQRLPQPAFERPWVPYRQRTRNACFVGRRTSSRPLRERLCVLLQDRYAMEVHENMPFADMLDVYSNTCLLPNECIAFESNFRLLEGAACGCCVLSPDVGEDQDELFTPNKEILVYKDAAELLSLMDFYSKQPHLAEKIGQAAHSRVQAEHLPRHRAKTVLDALTTASACAATGDDATEAFFMTMGMLCLNKSITFYGTDTRFPEHKNSINTLRLRLLYAIQQQQFDTEVPELLQTARQKLAHAEPSESAQALAVACGGGAVCMQNPDAALHFLVLYEGFAQRTVETSADLRAVAENWIIALIRDKKIITHGLQYHNGCCHSALDMIFTLAEVDSLDDTWARHMHSLENLRRTLPSLDMTAIARLSLNTPDSMEYIISYIAAALKSFDMQAAHKERAALLRTAQLRGMEKPILALLKKVFPYWQVED